MSEETTQALILALYCLAALAIFSPVAMWWERRFK